MNAYGIKPRTHYLQEFLSSNTTPLTPRVIDVDDFMDEWGDVFQSRDELKARLALVGLNPRSFRDRFAGGLKREDSLELSWYDAARNVAADAMEIQGVECSALIERHDETPFVHFTAPLIIATRKRIELPAFCSDTAVRSLEELLLFRITMIFQHPLFVQFKAFQRMSSFETNTGEDCDSTMKYDEFRESVFESGYETLFNEYPVLMRHLGEVIQQWIQLVDRLTRRIAADRPLLRSEFNGGKKLGDVVDFERLSDDPHGDGEFVVRVDFESDCSVIYKPRSVETEEAFNSIIAWVNGEAAIPDLYKPSVIDRGAYGWMEYVPVGDCETQLAVERYYRRAGGLLGIAFLLGSTDLHFENLRAVSDQPIIIDAETILSPRLDTEKKPFPVVYNPTFRESVLRCGLVPFTDRADDRNRLLGGLEVPQIGESDVSRPAFENVNTDTMEMKFEATFEQKPDNVPRINGKLQKAGDYLAELKAGFLEVAGTVLENQRDFIGKAGPLTAFEGCSVRYIFRPTETYARRLFRSLYSSRLRTGLASSLELERLAKSFVSGVIEDESFSGIIPAEQRALEHLVLPRFEVNADGTRLFEDRFGRTDLHVDEPALAFARNRIREMGKADLHAQLSILTLAFSDREVVDSQDVGPNRDEMPISGGSRRQGIVCSIIDALEEATDEGGEVGWVETVSSPATGSVSFGQPGYGLYEGYVGVGLFLAATAVTRDCVRAERLAKSVFQVILHEGKVPDSLEDESIGGIDGRGSIAYGLLRAGNLLEDEDLIEAAIGVASMLEQEEVQGDTEFDLMHGSAGELLVQHVIYEESNDERALERAEWCGEHLINHRTETSSGHRVWAPNLFERPISGFSHGAAGIGYALLRVGSRINRRDFVVAGREAIAFERDIQRQGVRQNYLGYEVNDEKWRGGWCHGRTGVALSRIGVSVEGVSIDSPRNLASVLDETDFQPRFDDSLCCGSCGLVTTLVDGSQVLADDALLTTANDVFRKVFTRAQGENKLRLRGHTPRTPRFSLFTGLSGIGYTALLLEDSECQLPNVCRLE